LILYVDVSLVSPDFVINLHISE